MTRILAAMAMAAALAVGAGTGPAAAKIVRTAVTGPYKLELNVLPPEPFHTRKEVDEKHVKHGMLIMGGAPPVTENAPSHPNYHLVVHVYDRNTHKAVTGATVSMEVEPLNDKGLVVPGHSFRVPVVEMRMIGKGPETTHYGNNVNLRPGTSYRVVVKANGHNATFKIKPGKA